MNKNKVQAPVAQTLDSATQRIVNNYAFHLIVVIFRINATSDISELLYVISRAVKRVKYETILKYHEWYFCQITRTNQTIICLYYYLQKVSNFVM